MRNIWRIARYEYIRHVRRRGFLFSAFGLPLLLAAIIAVVILVIDRTENSSVEQRLGVVDQTGQFAQIDVAVLDLSTTIPTDVFGDETAARTAFDQGNIDAYIVIPTDYIQTGQVRAVARDELSDAAETQLRRTLREGLLQNVPPSSRERVENPTELSLRAVESGRELGSRNIGLLVVPYLFAMVFFVTAFTTSGYLLQAITEEKEDRVSEILATTVRPEQMMAGKVLGLSGLGLTQMLVWAGFIAVPLLVLGRGIPFLAEFQLPWSLVAAAVGYYLLGYLLIAGCYAIAGAAMPTAQEASTLASPISLISVMPLMLIWVILSQPNGMVATIFSLIPFSAPITMLMRMTLADIPPWQVGLSFTLLALATAGAIWLAARVLRLGMLRYGQRLSLREVFGA